MQTSVCFGRCIEPNTNGNVTVHIKGRWLKWHFNTCSVSSLCAYVHITRLFSITEMFCVLLNRRHASFYLYKNKIGFYLCSPLNHHARCLYIDDSVHIILFFSIFHETRLKIKKAWESNKKCDDVWRTVIVTNIIIHRISIL